MDDTHRIRLDRITHLARRGQPFAALRSLAHWAQGAPAAARAAAQPAEDSPLYHALVDICRCISEEDPQHRPLTTLPDDLAPLLDLGGIFAHGIGEVEDRIARQPRPGSRRMARKYQHHFLAMLELLEMDVGLTVPVSWDSKIGVYDHAVPTLDLVAKQQAGAAGRVVQGLIATSESADLGAFNAERMVVAHASLADLGGIEGESLGLPTLLAMIAAWTGTQPALVTAATGALDHIQRPVQPKDDLRSDRDYEDFQDIPIGKVGGIELKITAVLEQIPSLRRILVPTENVADIPPALLTAMRERNVDLVPVARVADIFAGPALFSVPVFPAPLRLDLQLTVHEILAVTIWANLDLAAGALLAGMLLTMLLGLI